MTALRASVIALLLVSLAPLAAGAEPPAVRLVSPKPGEPPVVEVTGIAKEALADLAEAKLTADEWPKVARLVVDSGTPEEVAKKPPVAGTWSVTTGALRFEPQFALAPGVKYRVFCDLGVIPRTKR